MAKRRLSLKQYHLHKDKVDNQIQKICIMPKKPNAQNTFLWYAMIYWQELRLSDENEFSDPFSTLIHLYLSDKHLLHLLQLAAHDLFKK